MFFFFETSPSKTFNYGDLKFRDLAILCFFKLIMTKLNLKKSYVVMSVTSSPLCHRKPSPKVRCNFFYFAPPLDQIF